MFEREGGPVDHHAGAEGRGAVADGGDGDRRRWRTGDRRGSGHLDDGGRRYARRLQLAPVFLPTDADVLAGQHRFQRALDHEQDALARHGVEAVLQRHAPDEHAAARAVGHVQRQLVRRGEIQPDTRDDPGRDRHRRRVSERDDVIGGDVVLAGGNQRQPRAASESASAASKLPSAALAGADVSTT